MARQKKAVTEPAEIYFMAAEYGELFKSFYERFETTGYDTGLLLELENELLVYVLKAADAQETIAAKDMRRKLFKHDWRLFLEYAIRRIPQDDVALREILHARVRWAWEQSQESEVKRMNVELVRMIEKALSKTAKEIVENAFRELRAYRLIKGPKGVILANGMMFMPDGSVIDPDAPIEEEHTFGTVKDGVLHWIEDLNQLAWAISMIEEPLGYSDTKPYTVVKSLEGSGKIKIVRKRGSFTSLKTYLEQIRAEDFDVPVKDFVPQAARVLLTLFK